MADSRQINRLLEKRLDGRTLEESEAIALIHASVVDDIAQDIIKTAAMLERPHKEKVFALPPLYVDSSCENHCVYCNFRQDGDALSYEEFRNELKELLGRGYRSIEFVFGQNPAIFRHKEPFNLRNQQFDISRIIGYFEIAKEEIDSAGGGMLTLNAPPLDKDSYKHLKESGLDCFLLWAETFNPMQYARLHPGDTPKTEQRYRLESYSRAAEAGIEFLAGTFLKGLYDWRTEETMLCSLDRSLRHMFEKGFSIIGTPRYKGADFRLIRDYTTSDEDYILNIALDLLIYEGAIWLQTREPWQLNERIIDKFGGGFIITLDCSTAPGGYAERPKGHQQFPIHMYRPEMITSALDSKGIEVIYGWGRKEFRKLQRN